MCSDLKGTEMTPDVIENLSLRELLKLKFKEGANPTDQIQEIEEMTTRQIDVLRSERHRDDAGRHREPLAARTLEAEVQGRRQPDRSDSRNRRNDDAADRCAQI